MNVSVEAQVAALGHAHRSTVRERFCCVLDHGPILPCDAVVVPSGDGLVRLDVAIEALKQRIAHHVVVSGGLDNPPHSLVAGAMADYLVQRGLQRDRIIEDGASLNTREQAMAVAGLCAQHGWVRVALAVSPYHSYRLFLTFLRALREASLDRKVHMLALPAAQTSWFRSPDGLDQTRLALLDDEYRKISEYCDHVASYSEGLAYLKLWEGLEDDPR